MSRRSITSSPRRWRDAGRGFPIVDAVAAAAGPGLIGGVIVGLTTAKAIALVHEKPLIARQPSRSACADRAADRRHAVPVLPVPRLRRPHPDRRRCAGSASTSDSAPRSTTPSARPSTRPPSSSASAIRAARRWRRKRHSGDAARFALPRPMAGRAERRFLALRPQDRAAARGREDRAAVSDQDVCDLCASFQQAVVDVVADRLRVRLKLFRERAARRPRWSAPAASRPTTRSAKSCTGWRSRSAPCWWCRRPRFAPTTAR